MPMDLRARNLVNANASIVKKRMKIRNKMQFGPIAPSRTNAMLLTLFPAFSRNVRPVPRSESKIEHKHDVVMIMKYLS